MAKKLKIDFDEIRKLAELVQDTELSEIEIEEEDLRIRVSRGAQFIQSVAAPQPRHKPPQQMQTRHLPMPAQRPMVTITKTTQARLNRQWSAQPTFNPNPAQIHLSAQVRRFQLAIHY